MEYIEEDSQKKQILIIDDNAEYALSLQQYLSGNEFDVAVETESAKALSRIRDEKPDIVIIEVDLRGDSGLTICKLSRKDFKGGIFLVSHRTDELDQVLGLDMGADEYLARTVSPRLLLAKCQAYLRRDERSKPTVASGLEERLEFGNLVIDNSMREAWLNKKTIELTSAEFDLLWLLSSHAGEVLTREEIFSKLRGIEYDGQDRSVDVRVSRIRPKVGDDPIHPRRIKTVRSKGYLFVGEVKQ
ncbi:winged helix-turn-helix domain-containing protein [Reinekea marinisedimentorum]|uniref:Two-component system response regulator RstA n=1 Tax=Reinekea marinisedimentorum TaxID=230495 RepID=A0A4R3I7V6_9GAMM|nr:winged helix-turn-helix domain-containing protein [Reinekea marinisedimentorum]TCS41344.1 two-component system response regulator RstA [Reinekea marinisedimentorum]